jgi:adenine-specific DNA-methyltransferase
MTLSSPSFLLELQNAQIPAVGQFFTPSEVADFMASLFSNLSGCVRLLDAGAGLGGLTLATFKRCLEQRSQSVDVTLYEKDDSLQNALLKAINLCEKSARESKTSFKAHIEIADFLGSHLHIKKSFTHAILNPPYAKLAHTTELRQQLEAAGLDATNLYSAFLDLTMQLLENEGELVAITPRSFFNGTYFMPFRKRFLKQMRLLHIRTFESRRDLFSGVLQETVIIHAIKSNLPQERVCISHVSKQEKTIKRFVPYQEVVQPHDLESFIRVASTQSHTDQSSKIQALPNTLETLGLQISTGRVVDFRVHDLLRQMPLAGDHALLYPKHLQNGTIIYPLQSAKANAVIATNTSVALLVPEGFYVLLKRFSAKEEARRVVAALYEPEKARFGAVGFENHLNYIHQSGHGLTRETALGLVVYLNSTAFDTAFRVFSGHTQVNAGDIRNMTFPSFEVLQRLATRVSLPLPCQVILDEIVNEEVFCG